MRAYIKSLQMKLSFILCVQVSLAHVDIADIIDNKR